MKENLKMINCSKEKLDTKTASFVEGTFKDNSLNGKGKKTYLNGKVEEGTFENGNLIQGKMMNRHRDVFEGTFKDGNLNGKGKMVYNGDVYEGTFKGGELNGQAKLIRVNGDVVEGTFNIGQLDVQGKITRSNGVVEEGTIENDKLIQGNSVICSVICTTKVQINRVHVKTLTSIPFQTNFIYYESSPEDTFTNLIINVMFSSIAGVVLPAWIIMIGIVMTNKIQRGSGW